MHAISNVDKKKKNGHWPQLFGCTAYIRERSQLDGVVSTTLNEWLMGKESRVTGNG